MAYPRLLTLLLLCASSPVRAAQVLSVAPEDNLIKVSQQEEHKWALGDTVCINRNERELACGEVILITPTEATVKLKGTYPINQKNRKRGKFRPITKRTLPKAGENVKAEKSPIEPRASAAPVRLPTAAESSLTDSVPSRKAPLELSAQLGLAYHHYEQDSVAGFSMTALQAELGARYRLGQSPWSVAAGGEGTLVPFSSSRADQTVRFLSLSGNVRYSSLLDDLTVGVGLGFVYSFMIVPLRDFGVSRASEIPIHGLLSTPIADKTDLTFGLSFAPIVSAGTPISLGNRAWGVALGVSYVVSPGTSLLTSLTYRDLRLVPSSARSSTLVLSLGLGW